jgi:organic radical activating enzyme
MKGKNRSVKDITDIVYVQDVLNTERVTITGGEPLLQLPELEELILKLEEMRFDITVETNGSLRFNKLAGKCCIVMDMKPISAFKNLPNAEIKYEEYMTKAMEYSDDLRKTDWVKFPIQTREDLKLAMKHSAAIAAERDAPNIAFSPVSPIDGSALYKWIHTNRPVTRNLVLNVQLHKLIGLA